MSDLRTQPELLAAFREGTKAAVTAVYLAYLSRIEAWIRLGFPTGDGTRVPGIGNAADHAEAVQEVFMRAFALAARLAYDGQRDYWSYLSTIARNVVVDYHRSRGREIPFAGRDSGDPADMLAHAQEPALEDPEHGWLEHEAKAIVRGYVARLQEPERAVHDAIFDNFMTREAAARHLGVSEHKVRSLVERFKHEVRALLEQAGIRDSNLDPHGAFRG